MYRLVSSVWAGVMPTFLELGPVERRVGRHPWAMSRPVILHERGNLHELDARAHTVEIGHPLE
jgi:hypothetical protein